MHGSGHSRCCGCDFRRRAAFIFRDRPGRQSLIVARLTIRGVTTVVASVAGRGMLQAWVPGIRGDGRLPITRACARTKCSATPRCSKCPGPARGAISSGRSGPPGLSRQPGYTLGMKTAVSIPDELFSKAEDMARKTGKSRSRLYQEALSEYLLRRDPGAVTQAMEDALAEIDPQPDPWLIEAGRQTLERNEW